jgi:hypothetical protein
MADIADPKDYEPVANPNDFEVVTQPSATPQATSDSGFTFAPRSGAQMDSLQAREATPELQSGVEAAAKAAPEIIDAASKAQQAVINPLSLVTDRLTPEPVKRFMQTPLASPEAVGEVRKALEYPTPTLSNLLFGTKFDEQGPLATVGKFVDEQIAGQTTPENLAIIAGTEGVGAAEKILGKKSPSLARTLFGGQEQPEVLAATNEALSNLESKYAPPETLNANAQLNDLLSTEGKVTEQQLPSTPQPLPVSKPTTDIQPLISKEKVGQGTEAQPQTQEVVPQPESSTGARPVPVPKEKTGESINSTKSQKVDLVDSTRRPKTFYRYEGGEKTHDTGESGAIYLSDKPQAAFKGEGSKLGEYHISASKIATPQDVADLGLNEMRIGGEKGDISFLSKEEVDALKAKGFDAAEGYLDDQGKAKEVAVFDKSQIRPRGTGSKPVEPVPEAEVATTAAPEGLPPVKEGFVRLYRGEPSTKTNRIVPDNRTGRYFTEDPNQAAKYGDKMHYIVVPGVSQGEQATYFLPEELAKQKLPVTPESPPTVSESTPQGQATADEPALSRLANRHTEERAASGELGEISPGQGYSKSDLVKQGEKMSPEEVNQYVSDLMQKTGDPIKQASAVSAEEARLSQRSSQLSRIAESDPTNVEAKLAADNAFNDLTDFHKGPVARLKEVFHGTGVGLQGEVPVDLSTFNGMREAWLKDTGELPPPSKEPLLRKTAAEVSKSIEQDNGARTALSDAIEKQSSSRKLPSYEEVRNNIRERMGLEPCIT